MIFTFLKVSVFLILGILALVGIGVGFIWLIDYFDANPYGSKELVQKVLYTSVALHVLFLLTGMPILQILYSLGVQYCFNTLFDTYSLIRVEDPRFIGGLIGSLVNYFLMLRFFTVYEKKIILFIPYLCIIWATPVCFFFSISVNEDTLFVKKGGKKEQNICWTVP
ncbi:uncharacterized protein VICG_00453 [Vittaforma corneae ATCC 50505]|uniref:Uncharacterized protein n=1 Tax=Vittaforma corneae (strain ATCC 50505) TaxID=993615 RepID=L2GPB2_VITCO|nr:uncharacterized protein VICG_00453 [Vittaforma corneae ATCC 50505]ELA42355.1 hypothetical protein VICG_00453 [Vittaforma corneae ATCC 50505]